MYRSGEFITKVLAEDSEGNGLILPSEPLRVWEEAGEWEADQRERD